jgi:intracellular multiplication protein IcmD
MKVNVKSILKAAVYMIVAAGFFTAPAYAADTSAPTGSLGYVANTVTQSFTGLVSLIYAISYIAGAAMTIASVFKFKQHKDNPQQVPVTTGIAMLCFGVGLVFMPSILNMGGITLFGSTAQTAGPTGITLFNGANVPSN